MLPKFTDSKLLERALTHRSALNEPNSGTTSRVSNERLEFLGDAVLELATTEFLFHGYPQESEGKLTAYRSALVRTSTLAIFAQELGLGDKLYLSKGEEATGGRTNQSLLADTTEAVIGALYLDQGYDRVKQFLHKYLFVKFEQIKKKKLYKDPKSLLQELVQAKGSATPVYEVIREQGPDHNKEFTVQVLVNGQIKAKGIGLSKQEAQQQAAKKAVKLYLNNNY